MKGKIMTIEEQKTELAEAYENVYNRWHELTDEQKEKVVRQIQVTSSVGHTLHNGRLIAISELAGLAVMMLERKF